MQTEIEVKFPQIDVEDMRRRLQKAGAVCEQPMRLMRRRTFDNSYMKEHKGYGRVRDEGDKVTLTYKQFDDFSLHGAQEIEFVVPDFDMACEFMMSVGAGSMTSSYQESRRETWSLGEVEIAIDEWPWLEPYIEIEAANEIEIRRVAELLGFEWNAAITGSAMAMFWQAYPNSDKTKHIGDIPRVAFGEPLPDMLKA